MTYPDRYVITALVAEDSEKRHPAIDRKKGDRIWLYWTDEGGGWWQWGSEGWAYRFQSMDDKKLQEALSSAPKMGPWYNRPDPKTIEVRPVPAIVKVY